MKPEALIYCEKEFGKVDGKVANGLIRQSDTYKIVGVIDSSKTGEDSGECLDGVRNKIPIFKSLESALKELENSPKYFIYGIAPLTSFLNNEQKNIFFLAIKNKMNIVNGMPEFLNDNTQFRDMAHKYGVTIQDVRKPPDRKKLHNFTGRIQEIKTPIITVMGTDCAVGKRTSALLLVEALKNEGLQAVFVTTGQTGLLQGSKYGVAIDVLTSGFATGEVENAILNAYEKENPDIIIVEGQGALSHPAFTSSSAILRGSMPNAIIIQHPPKRKYYCDYPDIAMLTLGKEIEMIEVFSKSKVIAITINHEDMNDVEVNNAVIKYEAIHRLPTTDVLKYGCDKLIRILMKTFPELKRDPKLV
ncbi:DUF1611 domain-containing protein [Tenacibaculum sp. E3R01]|uniref:DUF1611 domain-containing protein n=1 Tax=unclassified Tenacibaculum TaxID=2635139 RepID=UPI00089A1EDD|nr:MULTISPECIES: DUF1611 domain-containing protein [unclassified Tenacibaculum]RBW55676.1 DUF1611 domain-containing protein [Tenacibaculum sp. E3R01]SEE60247.1 Uncharacterized conserved protein, NAD-dependent epimerase/dehydratase family [Tenacibaculum sp. MAR_2010_89]